MSNTMGFRENGPLSTSNIHSASKHDSNPHPQPNSSQQHSQNNEFGASEDPAPEVEDPLAGMNDKDRFGLKGLLAILKGPYPDQAALISGIDITTLGFDLNTTE
jgi:CCR4-NOT transcription complex subunit 2